MLYEYLRVFRAFSDKNRMQILELLCKGEQCACVLLENLKISQPTLSHHMKILCKSGIVKSRHVGSWNYYSIDKDGCEYASRLLTIIAKQELNTTIKIIKVLCYPLHGLKQILKEHTFEFCCCQNTENSGYVTKKG